MGSAIAGFLWLGCRAPGPATWLALPLGAVLLVSQAGAQPPTRAGTTPAPAPLAAATSRLAPVPKLQLVLPRVSGAMRHEGPPWLRYWREATVAKEWSTSTDADLRLELPTARLDLGRLSLRSQLDTVPGRERDCLSDCRGAQWSSSVRLKYDVGDVGPLRQAGPQLNLQGARPQGSSTRGFLGGGFGGKF
jgi:hypothetical protein